MCGLGHAGLVMLDASGSVAVSRARCELTLREREPCHSEPAGEESQASR